ncbi:uncharacterized protein LOC115214893 [Argonauta hians]
MDSKLLFWLVALSILHYNIGQTSASCAPCKNSWFKPNSKYIYEYSSVASAKFIGIEEVPAGGKLTCNVIVFTPCKCHENFKISMSGCSMSLVNQNGRNEPTRKAYKDLLKKYHVEFNLEDGIIKGGAIYSHKDEKTFILNIKRGIIRLLQLKVGAPETYNITSPQWDIYGSCPVNYEFSTQEKWTIHSELDITNCNLHSYFRYQFSPMSPIKKVTGGFHITNLTELQYPFQSKISCDYKIDNKDNIKSVSCNQRQDFEVLKHYGNVEATAMFNVSQSLELKKVTKGKSNLKLPGDSTRKTSLPFEFEETKPENPPSVSEINNILDKLEDAYKNDPLVSMSGYFYNLIKMTRNADQKTLENVFSRFNNCPQYNNQCKTGLAALKQVIYIDVLSNCGERKCIKAVVKNLAKLSEWKRNKFLLTLNKYPEVDEEILTDLLVFCKKERLNSCTTLTNLVATYDKMPRPMEMRQWKSPVYDTIEFYHDMLKQYGHDQKFEMNAIWVLKGLENLATTIQNVYPKIIPDVVECALSKHHSLAMRKSAIRALKNMAYNQKAEAALKHILSDGLDSVSVRTEAFMTLDKYERPDITSYLVRCIEIERIQEMKVFMQTYLINILQSEEENVEKRQKQWKKEISSSSFKFQEFLSMAKSKHISFSKTFTLPMLQYPFGGKIEAHIVYDPESMMPRNLMLKTKGQYGQNNLELLEINFELEGMEPFVKSLFMTRGMPLWKKLFFMWNKLTEFRPEPRHGKDFKFSLPDDDIVEELIKLLDVTNFPEEFIPRGYIHVKMYGYDMFMWDVVTFLKNIPNLKKTFEEELKSEKLRLDQMTELYRAFPTAFGVPYNMTLLIANVYHTSHTLTQPNTRSIKFRMAINFFAKLSLDLPGEMPEGLQMETEMEVYFGLSGRNQVTGGKKPGTSEHFKWTIEVDRTEKDVVLWKIKHRLYIVRGELIHVSADKSPSVKKRSINWCFTPLASILFRVKACFQLTSPDVLNSHNHAYMPLNGDIDVSLTLKPMDNKIESVQMEIEREITSSSKPTRVTNIKTAVISGSSTTDKVTINVKQSLDGDKLSVTTRFPDMQDINFNLELEKHRTKQIHKVNFDMTLTVLRIKEIFGVHFKGIQTEMRSFANARLNFMEVISETTIELSEINSKTVWHFNTKYHCPKSYGMLYQLHIDPEKAAKDNDVTHVKFFMKRIHQKSKKQKYLAERELKFLYPGHDYLYLSHMDEANGKGRLSGNVTWNHDWGQEYLEMKGEMTISNPSKDTEVELYKVVYSHKEDDTTLDVTFKKTTGPNLFMANYEIDYNKLLQRKKRSVKKIVRVLGDHAKKISNGDFITTPVPAPRTMIPSPSPPSPTPSMTPGPHHDIFYKIFNFLTNGPKNWITRVTIKLETVPQMNPRSKTIFSTEYKVDIDANYPQWTGQEKVKFGANFGVAQILDGHKKWADISVKGDRLPKNTDFSVLMIEKHNYMNYSYDLKSTNAVSRASFEKIGDVELNANYKLEVPFLKQNFDVHFHIADEDKKNHLKIKSDVVSERWRIFQHKYFSEQSWIGYFMLTPTYELDRVSSFEHDFVNYTSSWKLQRNPKDLSMDLKAGIHGKHLSIISMDGHVTLENHVGDRLPSLMVKLYLPDVNIRCAGRLIDEKNILIDINREVSGRTIPVANWSMSLSSASVISQDIYIQPMVIKPLRMWMRQTQRKFYYMFAPFVAAVDSSSGAPYSQIVIPYWGKTIGELAYGVFYSSVRTVMPFLDIMPLSSRPMSEVFYERIMKASQSFKKKYEGSIFEGPRVKALGYGAMSVMKAMGNYIQERVKNYPRLLNLYMERAVKARLMPMISQGKIHFPLFHPFIWKSFKKSPELTTALHFLLTKVQSRDFRLIRSFNPHVAILSGEKVVTFDGYLYNLPSAFGSNRCTHLMAADISHKSFAILRQNDGIVLSCASISLKIFNNCSLEADGNSKPIELPYQCPMKMTAAKMWGPYVIVTSVYGVEIMCSSSEMKIIFNGIHHNHTIGLLGTADGDFGTDMKLTDGTLAANTAEFINHYELSKESRCQVSKRDLTQSYPRQCSAETKQKCTEMFALYLSPLKSCFDINNPINYLDHCIKSCAGFEKKPNICSLVSTYVSQCQPKNDINLPKSCIKCTQTRKETIWQEKTRRIKRDVVIILDEQTPIAKYAAHNYVYSLFELVQIKSAMIGLVAYGGSGVYEHPNVFTINGNYFGNEDNIYKAMENLKKSYTNKDGDSDDHDHHGHASHGHNDEHFHKEHKSPLYYPHNNDHFGHQYSYLHEALDWAADYFYKKDSGRMIIIFADISTLQNTTDLAETVSMLVKRDIVVNIFTDTTKMMSKKYYGLTYDGKVLHKSKKQVSKVPTDEYFRLVQNTRGVLWNAKLILSQNSGFTKVVNREMEAQMSEKRCRNCKCIYSKEKRKSVVECVADDLSSKC